MHTPAQPPEGTLWKDVYPPPDKVCPPPVPDGRTQALDLLKRYLGNLKFYKEGVNDTAKPLCVPDANIKEQAPDYEDDLEMPAIGMIAGEGEYLARSLTPTLDESTVDKYCPGTVVHIHDEYSETVTLEIWTSTKQELRAITGGIESAFQPSQEYTGLRFVMRGYYNGTVIFTLISKQIIDDADASLKRRKAQIKVHFRFNVLSLEPYRDFAPRVQVETV